MKKFIFTAAAVLFATTAYATDLPSKKTAPLPPVAAAAAPASVDSLTVTYGQDLANNFGTKADDVYQLAYKHSLGGGFSIGGMAQTTQVSGSNLKQNLEAQAGYALPAIAGVSLSGKAGIGERFIDTGNFAYYAAYGNADYKVTDSMTFNTIQYRYRNAFDAAANSYQSHQIGTGVTFDITPTYSISAKVARNYDSAYNATGDYVGGSLSIKF